MNTKKKKLNKTDDFVNQLTKIFSQVIQLFDFIFDTHTYTHTHTHTRARARAFNTFIIVLLQVENIQLQK